MKTLNKTIASAAAVLVAGICSLAWAAPPDHANGVPTEKFPWGPFEDLGIPLVDCGDFWINIDWRGEGFWTTHYNKDGTPKFEFFLGKDTYLFWYNSEKPGIGFMSHGTKINRHWFGAPFDSDRAEVGLSFSLNVPGYGVVFHDVGRIIFERTTGEVLFSAGPHTAEDALWVDSATVCSMFAG